MAGGSILSFDVLVVPEDPSNNGYILKPLVTRILLERGKPSRRRTGSIRFALAGRVW